MKRWIITVIMLCLSATVAYAGEKKPVKPLQKDKCPVCGMFVAKYPDFVAEIIYKDGSYAVFDGVKDMLKFYFRHDKYQTKQKQADIGSVYVTDYYDLTFIDGTKAFYVMGSDVYGPMGRELIPFSSRANAEEFRKDHKGKSVLEFRAITYDAVKGLD